MKLLPNVYNVEDINTLEQFASVEFEAENEEISPEGQFDDKETANEIVKQYEDGNEAAWFSAKVTVLHKDFVETDYLGCCSYKSFKEFKNDPYYLDMINTCVNEINRQIESINYGIKRQWDIRKAKRILAPYDLVITDLKTIPAL